MKREDEKILILYASFGEGHKQVAVALEEEINATFAPDISLSLDIMKITHPYTSSFTHTMYRQIITTIPSMYSYLYRKTYSRGWLSQGISTLLLTGADKLADVIETVQPTIIISTYPFAAGLVDKLKKDQRIHVPSITVLTDYAIHSYWIHETTDMYFVGSDLLKQRLIDLGISADKIRFTGIPVRSQFHHYDRLDPLQIGPFCPDRFTLLIMGGGEGLFGNETALFRNLDEVEVPIQVIIVCGKNQKLKVHLEKELRDSKHDIHIYGFVEDIQQLMAIADVMISKPGGITTTEALTMELPLLIQHVLPGQEEENVHYLVDAGFALYADTTDELREQLKEVITDTRTLHDLRYRIHERHRGTPWMDELRQFLQSDSEINRMEQTIE